MRELKPRNLQSTRPLALGVCCYHREYRFPFIQMALIASLTSSDKPLPGLTALGTRLRSILIDNDISVKEEYPIIPKCDMYRYTWDTDAENIRTIL